MRLDFHLICKLGEGTFSEVMKVKHKKSGRIFAMKKFRKHYMSLRDVNDLQEVYALRLLNPHPCIIDLYNVIYEKKTGIVTLNFELMSSNLYELISKDNQNIPENTVKQYMYQVLVALEYIHGKGIFHRDLKPENILVKGKRVKIADFGSCRDIDSKPPYTEYIATRWYRSPECLLCNGQYSYKMDIWSAGCVFFEIISKNPLFPGNNEIDQIYKIHSVLGTPEPQVLKSMLG
ncbi:kinase-like protein [Neocallimastix californiae]|uniref:Kinase-like protein n=1 Tax=Neocallimastix californiae TaxID=1754190 RepID=A0A1Y2ACF2_9FUNG|nr:kinase-like protein [Neocallimastix californiae]|eukprot:ORY20154.1 kinase-like protein [Neocallimastix californiae]